MSVRTAALVLLIYGALSSAVLGQGGALQTLVNTAASSFPGKAGIFVKHLKTGEEAAIRADESFNSASVIKIPVLVMAFQMADRGALNLDERVTIRKEDIRGGSGIFKSFDTGLQPTWRDVLFQMVITSDNTATDLAIAKVGGVARVNAWLVENKYQSGAGSRETGVSGLRLVQTTGDLFAKYNALTPADDRNAKTNGDKNYWLGDITPRATARLIEAIEKKTIAKPESCDTMLRMMRAQLAGSRRLPHFITVPVAHKTGDFAPVLANDVGIIYAPSGSIVVAFLGNGITGNYGEAEDAEGRFAQRLLEYFDK